MSPIPLTLIGIIPGHLILDAEFTATSMIGFIALAGIIVRNSILLVDFSKNEVARGVPVRTAVIHSCKARTRPILITAFALLLASSVILFDPIFQGMAISLMFGGIVSTLLTLLVIPLGCISSRGAFCPPDGDPDGNGSCAIDAGGSAAEEKDSGSSEKSSQVAEKLAFIKGLLAMMFAMTLSMIYSGFQKLKARREERRKSKEPPSSFETQAVAPSNRVVVRTDVEAGHASVQPETKAESPLVPSKEEPETIRESQVKKPETTASAQSVATVENNAEVKKAPATEVVETRTTASKVKEPTKKKEVVKKKSVVVKKKSVPEKAKQNDVVKKKAVRKQPRGIRLKDDLNE